MTKSVKLVLLGLVGLLLLCLAAAYGKADKMGGFASSVLVLVGGSTGDEGGSFGARTPNVTAKPASVVPQLDDPVDTERRATARVLATLREWSPLAAVSVLILVLALVMRPLRSEPNARYWSMRGRRDNDGDSMPRHYDYTKSRSQVGSST